MDEDIQQRQEWHS